jgi:hypothetical protein
MVIVGDVVAEPPEETNVEVKAVVVVLAGQPAQPRRLLPAAGTVDEDVQSTEGRSIGTRPALRRPPTDPNGRSPMLQMKKGQTKPLGTRWTGVADWEGRPGERRRRTLSKERRSWIRGGERDGPPAYRSGSPGGRRHTRGRRG